jgi:hypothetical protein
LLREKERISQLNLRTKMRIFTGLFFGPQWFKNDLSF